MRPGSVTSSVDSTIPGLSIVIGTFVLLWAFGVATAPDRPHTGTEKNPCAVVSESIIRNDVPHGACGESVAVKGVPFVPAAPGTRSGYDDDDEPTETMPLIEYKLPEIVLMADGPAFRIRSLSWNDSPGSTMLSPSPPSASEIARWSWTSDE